MTIYATLIFILTTVCSIVILLWFKPDKGQQRLQDLAPAAQKDAWVRTVIDIASPLSRLSIPDGRWEDSPLRTKFIKAGFRHEHAPVIFYAAKTLLPLVLAGIGYAALLFFGKSLEPTLLTLLLVALGTMGCYLPNLLLDRTIRRRTQEIIDHFPDAVDLILICVEAGLGLDAAMIRVAEDIKEKSLALAEELHLTNLETRAGFSRQQSFRNLAIRTGIDEVNSFILMLLQSNKFGSDIADSLRNFSSDLRYKRQVRAEELSARLPTKMLFPLVLCIFPAIILVILGPALIQMSKILGPMLAG